MQEKMERRLRGDRVLAGTWGEGFSGCGGMGAFSSSARRNQAPRRKLRAVV